MSPGTGAEAREEKDRRKTARRRPLAWASFFQIESSRVRKRRPHDQNNATRSGPSRAKDWRLLPRTAASSRSGPRVRLDVVFRGVQPPAPTAAAVVSADGHKNGRNTPVKTAFPGLASREAAAAQQPGLFSVLYCFSATARESAMCRTWRATNAERANAPGCSAPE